MTKKILVFSAAALALFFAPTAGRAAPETYQLDPAHTSVVWKAGHFGFSNPHGLFSMIEGTIIFDESAPEKSSINATVNTGNLFTGNQKFDDHLKSKDFFNIGEFPKATFVSNHIEITGEKTAAVTGNLTMIGITKPVTLNVTYNKKGENVISKKPTIGFSATGVIKRSDFGMVFGTPGIPDSVEIAIEAEANRDS